ncbi:MAG: hydrolase Nlp/P60 [Firmicutes bacterium HGW-Firmicutes-2]|jgi:cell wall-associated NlpC family hydrolase|nr:MAG: hydrolase Nlp/P60 [Firmicutes bacterium HGW-Firmicutes-2]
MANPALIAKAVAVALSDNRIRKGVGWIMAAVLSPIIVIIAIVCGMLSGAATSNASVLELCFGSSSIDASYPVEYRTHIETMRSCFSTLDGYIQSTNGAMENGHSLDSVKVKSIFYSQYFGEADPASYAAQQFVDCFVTYEERTELIDNGDGTTSESTYTVAVPISDLSVIYQNIGNATGTTASYSDMANATDVYYRIAYGTTAPLEADGSNGWDNWIYTPTAEELANLYHSLPEGELGSEIVLQAMTRLGDPYSQALRGQGDYVDCSYLTMWCYGQIGITIPGTAAEQARYCYNNGLTITREDLVPGDLVFWSYEPNGRFMNITHVGIYAGDDMVIDASSTKGVVVYRNIYHTNKQVLYGRPHIEP